MDSTKPLLIFPQPELVDTPRGYGGGSLPPQPRDYSKRAERIAGRFTQAISYIQATPGDSNHVLVIETVGKFQGFHKAVSKIDGLEWIAEFEVDEVDLEEMYDSASDDYKEARKQGGKWYLSSSNQRALEELLSRYQNWKETGHIAYGFGSWKNFFTYIVDLHLWNEKDRLENTEIVEQWKEEVEIKRGTASECNFEIELHYQRNNSDADRSQKNLVDHIKKLNGKIGKAYRNTGIAFHALKATLPVAAVEHVLTAHTSGQDYPQWISLNSIKYCRPIGQQSQDAIEPEASEYIAVEAPGENPPVIALLDGVPLVNHQLIRDFIVLDDPDNFSAHYQPPQYKHGTAMTSLICHNDFSNPERKSIQRKIYVRPIMQPSDSGRLIEKIPDVEFAEDLIERAVVRMIKGSESSEPACPSVKIINLSIGNIDQQFVREMSSWAKLLDWLSWEYKVLFIVSAGNYPAENITVADGNNVTAGFIGEINNQQFYRKILSPAESMNSLMVGAIQHDHSAASVDGLKNPYANERLPAEYSRIGPGFRTQIKPDILVAGGKQLYQVEQNEWIPQYGRKDIGQKVASVGFAAEDIAYTTHTFGTSNATAITTHAAARLYEVIDSLDYEGNQIPEESYALVLKSLLVHGASWNNMNECYSVVRNEQNSRKIKRIYANHLGYGEANFERVMSCTARRVTLIGFGRLSHRKRHRFQLPIPDDFRGLHLRLTATLTWFTPVNPFRYGWRQAKLFFEISDYAANGARQEADWQQVKKGTVQHEIFNISSFAGDMVEIFVQCAADASENFEDEIPYAISFTVEAMQETAVDLYTMISESIGVRV